MIRQLPEPVCLRAACQTEFCSAPEMTFLPSVDNTTAKALKKNQGFLLHLQINLKEKTQKYRVFMEIVTMEEAPHAFAPPEVTAQRHLRPS